ncbi:MAG: hypothetical protein ABI318_01860, partial [Chthoniobacteraceae bacterium]
MTQIVGIVGKDSIVIGSDSQFTGSCKQLEQEKMQVIPFKDGQLVIAFAVAVGDARRALDIMREMAATLELHDETSGAATALKAISQYRREVLNFYGSSKYLPPAEQDKIFSSDDRRFVVMLGYFYGSADDYKPALFTIDSAAGTLERKRDYGILGSGSDFAS